MEELEKKLSYENNQFQFDDRSKTWDMKEGRATQRFEHTDQSVYSDSTAEKLRSLDKEIGKSNKKLEKLDRSRRVVRQVHINTGAAGSRLKERAGRGKLYSRTYSRLLKRMNPGLGRINAGPVSVRFRAATQKDLRRDNSRRRRLDNRNYARRLLFREAGKAMENDKKTDDASTDSLMKDGKETGRKAGRLLYRGARRAADRLQENHSVYKRYDEELLRNKRLQEERRRLNGSGGGSNPPASSEAFKRRVKKRQVTEHHRQNQEGFRKRVSGFLHKTKKARERVARTKRTLAGLFSGTGTILLLAGAALILLFAVLAVISSGTSIGAAFISMNDYGTMTDVTNYFNNKCTNLYMYLNIDRNKNIEPDLEKELNMDIFEFIYDVDRPITYEQIDLIAYLSAKYGSFTLDMVQEELADIFAKMFEVVVEVKAEQREVPDPDTGEMRMEDKNICYITLKITSFDDVIDDRLNDGQKNAYLGYRLSSCGQQVMNPVMEEDWTNLISSPFGSRYHPIHKEYRMHNGVDIAVPTGTKVYAAVSGEVTAARYSDSAGYMVSITDSNGFTVTYMHLSSYAVAVGQKISAGQMVALSGNTGNSTGPHLHLAVQDAEGNYLNPVFMIPQTCVMKEPAAD